MYKYGISRLSGCHGSSHSSTLTLVHFVLEAGESGGWGGWGHSCRGQEDNFFPCTRHVTLKRYFQNIAEFTSERGKGNKRVPGKQRNK